MEENKKTEVEVYAEDKKGAGFKGILKKSADVGQRIVQNVQSGIKEASEKAKEDQRRKRLKKYNPLFPDVFYGENFKFPNIIAIVDDAVRKNVDVCEGAIGWLDSASGAEVLYLYDEEVTKCGLQFLPAPTCDAMYYVDTFDRAKFVRTDCIFSRAHEERLAELRHIAHALGAVRCSVEISESRMERTAARMKMSANQKLKFAQSDEQREKTMNQADGEQRFGRCVTEFEGGAEPRTPELKWFANDENIKRLIEMRCGGKNSVKSETLELSGSSSATMSQKAAIAVDGALKAFGMSSKTHAEIEKQASREINSKLVFCLEF